MPSVASDGTTERIVARISFTKLRAGSGTPAIYLLTSLAEVVGLGFDDLRLLDEGGLVCFAFFIDDADEQRSKTNVERVYHAELIQDDNCYRP
jgi:hypothetical protein